MTETRTDRINQEACEWVAKMHGAELSAQDLAALRKWMQQSAEHKTTIRRMARRWGELNVLTELAVPVEAPRTHKLFKISFFLNRLDHWAAIGAVVTITVLVALVFWPSPSVDPASPVAPLNYATAIGEQRQVRLPDNSIVLLNTNSEIKVDYAGDHRNIHLVRGEAHFDVTSDPSRPFRVIAGSGIVRAVGTAFSVHLKRQVVEVTVTKGTVQIKALQDKSGSAAPSVDAVENLAVVNAGQSAVFDQVVESIESIQTIDRAEISRKLAWQEGLLRFSGSPLHEVIEEVGRYTPMSIVIMDPELREEPIGGLFEVGETEKMFEALERGFGVRIERIDDNIVHLSRVTPASNER